MDALTKIQLELKAPKKQFNKFGNYNYRNCEDILEAVKPLLEKYKCGLVLSDDTKEVAGIPVVTATAQFTESGGEQFEVTAQAGVDINRKGMDISQSFGASSSYARKYALGGLFLLDDTKDADATNTHGKQQSVGEPKSFQTYKTAMKNAKNVTTVKDIAKSYNKEVENDWLPDEVDEAGKIYHARLAEFESA